MQGIILASIGNAKMVLFKKKEKEKISEGDSVHSKNITGFFCKINANYTIYMVKKKYLRDLEQNHGNVWVFIQN